MRRDVVARVLEGASRDVMDACKGSVSVIWKGPWTSANGARIQSVAGWSPAGYHPGLHVVDPPFSPVLDWGNPLATQIQAVAAAEKAAGALQDMKRHGE